MIYILEAELVVPGEAIPQKRELFVEAVNVERALEHATSTLEETYPEGTQLLSLECVGSRKEEPTPQV